MEANARQEFFNQLNHFFDHIYVVTLQRATDRHHHIKQELNGLHYQLFFGKDKEAFDLQELGRRGIYNDALAKKHHRYGKPMQPGQIGCAWSHAEIYREMLKNNFQRVLILEDDILIDNAAAAVFKTALKQLPTDWELLYLGFAEREQRPALAGFKQAFYHLLRALGLIKFSHVTIKNLYPKKITSHLYEAGYHDCTHAYGLTRSGAEKLLHHQTPLSYVADNLLAEAATNQWLKAYIIWPRIIYQQYQKGMPGFSYLNQ